jgi:DNA-directed RNA polymerase specialized sigma24 family protein
VKSDAAIEGEPQPNRFATTRWSLILACANSDATEENARQGLAELCRIYWRPIFAFICRRGYSISDAQDLTQDFFLMVLEGDLLSIADPDRGRFRSLLLKALQNFLTDNHDRRNAEKRGGGKQFVPWNDWMAEAPSHFSTSIGELQNWPVEKIFDLRWATTVTEEALRRLADECENCGRRRLFSVLSKYLTSDRSDVSYAKLSVALGVAESSVKRLLHHLRARYRIILRDEVSQTVENAEDVDDEIRYLCAVLATSGF